MPIKHEHVKSNNKANKNTIAIIPKNDLITVSEKPVKPEVIPTVVAEANVYCLVTGSFK